MSSCQTQINDMLACFRLRWSMNKEDSEVIVFMLKKLIPVEMAFRELSREES
jgi:hypothetical protein